MDKARIVQSVSMYNQGYEQGKEDAVIHAHWEVRKSWNGCTPDLDVCCSNCGHEYGCTNWNYCPNCGAKMDEEVK